MRETHLTIPELALVAGTRGALGIGVGLLLANRLPPHERRAVGWTLVGVGIVTTFPLMALVFGKSRPFIAAEPIRSSEYVGHS